MPAFLENALRASAEKNGFSGRRLARYVHGGMNNLGAMRGAKVTPKGRRERPAVKFPVRERKA